MQKCLVTSKLNGLESDGFFWAMLPILQISAIIIVSIINQNYPFSLVSWLIVLLIRREPGTQIAHITLLAHSLFLGLKIQSVLRAGFAGKWCFLVVCMISIQLTSPSSCCPIQPLCIHSPFPQHWLHWSSMAGSQVCVQELWGHLSQTEGTQNTHTHTKINTTYPSHFRFQNWLQVNWSWLCRIMSC